jgi:hypothetical protein
LRAGVAPGALGRGCVAWLRETGHVVDLDDLPFFVDRVDPGTRAGRTPTAAAHRRAG